MSCDVGEVTESLENEQSYVTAHSPTLPSLYLRHNSFSNPSVASLTSQLILQPFYRFSYGTGFSLTSPAELPMEIIGMESTRGMTIYSLMDNPVLKDGFFILNGDSCSVMTSDSKHIAYTDSRKAYV